MREGELSQGPLADILFEQVGQLCNHQLYVEFFFLLKFKKKKEIIKIVEFRLT